MSDQMVSLARFSTQPFMSWVDEQIKAILTKYFDMESKLIAKYWPRHVRDFLVIVLSKIILYKDPEEVAQFLNITDLESLNGVIDSLREPTKNYIVAKKQEIIKHLLCHIQTHSRELGIQQIKPLTQPIDVSGCEWPKDLMDREDLNQSLTRKFLRRDVKGYVWNFLDSILGTDAPVMISYEEGMSETNGSSSSPIKIIVEPKYSDLITSQIKAMSEELRDSCDGLLPSDVISIVPDANIAHYTNVKENFNALDLVRNNIYYQTE